MRIVKVVMVPALIFGVVEGLFRILPELLPKRWMVETTPQAHAQMLMIFYNVLRVVGWIWLAAKFVIMYRVGKKVDLRSNIKPTIVSLLLGGWIGYYVTVVAALPLTLLGATYTSPYFELTYILWNIYYAVWYAISLFLGSFTPMAIAYLKAQNVRANVDAPAS